MLKLSIHTLIISALLMASAAFATDAKEEHKAKNATDLAIESSIREAFKTNDLKGLEGDKMFTAAFSVLDLKDDPSKTVDPRLTKVLPDVKGQEALFKHATPASIALIETMAKDQKISSDPEKAKLDKYFVKLTAGLIVAGQVIHGESSLKDWTPDTLRQMPSVYSNDAERNYDGMAAYSMVALLHSVLERKPISPAEAEVEGGAKWIQHLRPQTTWEDAKEESLRLLKCRGIKAQAVGA